MKRKEKFASTSTEARNAASAELQGVPLPRSEGGFVPLGGGYLPLRKAGEVPREPVRFACSMHDRLAGLLHAPRASGALVLASCNDIHTVGMHSMIDVAFVDKRGTVLASYRGIGPGKRLRCHGAAVAIERFSTLRPWFSPGDNVALGIVSKEETARSRQSKPASARAVAPARSQQGPGRATRPRHAADSRAEASQPKGSGGGHGAAKAQRSIEGGRTARSLAGDSVCGHAACKTDEQGGR